MSKTKDAVIDKMNDDTDDTDNTSLLERIKTGDKKSVKKWNDDAEKGKTMRIV